MITLFFSTNGMFNGMRKLMGLPSVQFMGKSQLFPWIYVLSNVWKNLGWNSIIYIAALASVEMDLYEAARIDGANKLHIIWHIEIPSIMPTMVVLLIMNCGRVMSVGHEQILLLQNSLNSPTSEIISPMCTKWACSTMTTDIPPPLPVQFRREFDFAGCGKLDFPQNWFQQLVVGGAV